MDNKILNKMLNFIFVILLVLFVAFIIVYVTEPLRYNMDVKVQGESIDKSPYIYSALDKYIYAIKREKIENIDKCLSFVRRKDDKIYTEYSNYINENYNSLNIISISKIDGNKVLVKYSINDEITNNVIIKLFGNTEIFKVYYDEKLENI